MCIRDRCRRGSKFPLKGCKSRGERVKEEVDSLGNRHHDDVGETRLEDIRGQDPLEPALSLDFPAVMYKLSHVFSHFAGDIYGYNPCLCPANGGIIRG